MFCNQCEQTLHGTGCSKTGVYGKQPEAAAIQDLIVYSLRGLAPAELDAKAKGVIVAEIDRLCVKALFTTVTNVNFDEETLLDVLRQVVQVRKELAGQAGVADGPPLFRNAAEQTLWPRNCWMPQTPAPMAIQSGSLVFPAGRSR